MLAMLLGMNNNGESKGGIVGAGGRDDLAVARLRAACLKNLASAETWLSELEALANEVRGNLRKTRMGLADTSVSLGAVALPGGADLVDAAARVSDASARIDALLMAGYEAEGGGQ